MGIRLVVGGSRWFTFEHFPEMEYLIAEAEQRFGVVDELIHGDADGADQLADMWAKDRAIPRTIMPVGTKEWKLFGPGRGPERNKRMLTRGTHYAALWDGESPGTGGLIRLCSGIEFPKVVHIVRKL